jgi:hypothetical protein
LNDGVYSIDFKSADNAGNGETAQTRTVILDNSGPVITVENPPSESALQDGVNFIVNAIDQSGVQFLKFSVREADSGQGKSVGFENLLATYNVETKKWNLSFNTLQLPDGFYIVIVDATDNLGNTGLTTVPYSIRNWAVLELLPSSENNKAGRTMPVKFSLRVAASVDPSQPFVYNEDLDIMIYTKALPGNTLLQTSKIGTTSTSYRIDTIGEKYITNFKTLSTPATYLVEVYRNDFRIDGFEFRTIK